MIKWIKTIWKDPVWSKVISKGIIYLFEVILGAIGLWILKKQELLFYEIPLYVSIILLFALILVITFAILSHFANSKNRKNEIEELQKRLNELEQELNYTNEYNANHKEVDKNLFVRIKDELLPANGSVAYFDYGGAHTYDNDKLKEFYDFLEKCRNKTFYFHDDNANLLMQKLISEIRNFVYIVGKSTWPVNNSEMWAVPAEWKYKYPERFDATIDILNNSVSQLVEAYSNFIVYGRKKFAV